MQAFKGFKDQGQGQGPPSRHRQIVTEHLQDKQCSNVVSLLIFYNWLLVTLGIPNVRFGQGLRPQGQGQGLEVSRPRPRPRTWILALRTKAKAKD